MGLLTEEVLNDLLDFRNARRPADQDDLVDLLDLQAGVLEGLLHRRNRALDEIVRQLLELGPSEAVVQMLRTLLRRGDEGQVDVRRHRCRQLHLGLLGGLLEPLERHGVLRQVDALILLELSDEPIDDALIEVVATEVRVPVRRLHLEDTVSELQNGDVVRAPA